MQKATPVPFLVPPETHGWAYLAKWTLRVVFLLGVSLALAGQATAAPVVFEASGEVENGWAMSGTMTIDTATGNVLSADVSVTQGSVVKYVFDDAVSVRHSGGWTSIEIGTDSFLPILQLTVETSTLVGYKGSLISLKDSYILLSAGSHYLNELPLISGSLEPK